jgi:hypothetical protein
LTTTRDRYGREINLDLFANAPLRAGPSVKVPRHSTPKARGYAYWPGTGPAGETCKTCQFIQRHQHAKVYIKCGHKCAPAHTGGPATDIRARSPACKYWEPIKSDNDQQ